MARHKDYEWNLTDTGTPQPGGSTSYRHETILLALLMDLRDGLKEINTKLRSAGYSQDYTTRELRGLRRDLKARLNPRCHRAHR